MGLILLALGIWNNNQNKGKKLKVTLCLIAAMLFHISAVPVVISLVILMISNISLNKILLIWLFFSVLFLTGLNSSIASIPFIGNSEFLLSYTAVEAIDAFGEVNKSTFFIFSLFVLIISLIFYYKTQLGEREKVVYLNLIKSYLIINILFLAFGFIAYSNRLASFSWIFIPLLIMYPVLHNKINNRYILFIILLIFVVIGFLTSAYSIFMI